MSQNALPGRSSSRASGYGDEGGGVSEDAGRRAPGGAREARGTVLIIDDDASILEMVSEVLVSEGYKTLGARDGKEALGVLERARPHVILLDMRMPVMDGWAFASALRKRGQQAPPVIVMTAAEDARRWAAEISAQGYLEKPFDLDDLLAVVKRFAEQKPRH
jgi:two-component system chemotaxis response regulator CheY